MEEDDDNTNVDSFIKLNLGIPFALIANKSDLVHGPMAEFYKGKFDFIMRHLREYTIMFGGSLFAASSVKECNQELII